MISVLSSDYSYRTRAFKPAPRVLPCFQVCRSTFLLISGDMRKYSFQYMEYRPPSLQKRNFCSYGRLSMSHAVPNTLWSVRKKLSKLKTTRNSLYGRSGSFCSYLLTLSIDRLPVLLCPNVLHLRQGYVIPQNLHSEHIKQAATAMPLVLLHVLTLPTRETNRCV